MAIKSGDYCECCKPVPKIISEKVISKIKTVKPV